MLNHIRICSVPIWIVAYCQIPFQKRVYRLQALVHLLFFPSLEALVGVTYEHKAIQECLVAMDIGRYFDGVQPEELLPLIIDQ